MDYFFIEQSDYIKGNKKEVSETEEATICKVKEIMPLKGMDFLAEENLVSDQLKLLLESYLPKAIWKAYVFVEREKAEQEVFWYLNPPEYIPEQVELSQTGVVSRIQVDVLKVPRIFQMEQRNGKRCNIIHLSVAESILRRGILGLELIPLSASIT